MTPRAVRARSALLLASLLALAAAVSPRAARARSSPIDLEWSAPPECPSRDAVRAAVDRDLAASTGNGAPIVARGRVERSGDRWVAHLSVAGAEGSGERTLHASSCQELADAAALIFALAIDPRAAPPPPAATNAASSAASSAGPGASSAPSASPSASPASSAPARPPPPKIPEDAPARKTPENPDAERAASPPSAPSPVLARDGLGAGAFVVGDVGLLPRAVIGASFDVVFRWRVLRVSLDGTWLSGTHASAAISGPGGDFSFLAAGGRVAYLPRFGRFEVGPAIGAELDRMHAAGYGVSSPSSDTGAWVTLRGGATAAMWLVRGVALLARVEAEAPLSRPTFALEGVGSVHRPAPFGGRAVMGAEAIFF